MTSSNTIFGKYVYYFSGFQENQSTTKSQNKSKLGTGSKRINPQAPLPSQLPTAFLNELSFFNNFYPQNHQFVKIKNLFYRTLLDRFTKYTIWGSHTHVCFFLDKAYNGCATYNLQHLLDVSTVEVNAKVIFPQALLYSSLS